MGKEIAWGGEGWGGECARRGERRVALLQHSSANLLEKNSELLGRLISVSVFSQYPSGRYKAVCALVLFWSFLLLGDEDPRAQF